MRYALSILLISATISQAFAQKNDYIWHIGFQSPNAMVLDFNYPDDSIYYINRVIRTNDDNASICNTDGYSLFMTNGLSIADSSGQIMQNGTGLNPGTVAQWYPLGYPIADGAIVLPNPRNDSIYQLFHLGIDTGGVQSFQVEQLYVTTINMNLNNNKGAVINKNRLLVADTLFYGHLEAVKHANGEDWWVLVPELQRNGFYRFLLTADSILGPYYQQIGQIYNLATDCQAAFSADGNKYARYSVHFDLDIYDFDRCTGLLSNYLHIPIQDSADGPNGTGGGVAFSPNSQYLYVSSVWMVYQYDMWASNIPMSKDTVAIFDGFHSPAFPFKTTFFLAQLAPNGKIYLNCTNGNSHFHIIHSPDSAGVACDFEQHGLFFPSPTSITLPNFAHYRTPASGVVCDSVMGVGIADKPQEIKLYPNPATSQVILEWQFGSEGKENAYKIIISNALGQIVYQQRISDVFNTIDITDWSSGLYFCKFYQNGEDVHTEKLVIIKP